MLASDFSDGSSMQTQTYGMATLTAPWNLQFRARDLPDGQISCAIFAARTREGAGASAQIARAETLISPDASSRSRGLALSA